MSVPQQLTIVEAISHVGVLVLVMVDGHMWKWDRNKESVFHIINMHCSTPPPPPPPGVSLSWFVSLTSLISLEPVCIVFQFRISFLKKQLTKMIPQSDLHKTPFNLPLFIHQLSLVL